MILTYVEVDSAGKILRYGRAQHEVILNMESRRGGEIKVLDREDDLIDPVLHRVPGYELIKTEE